MKKIIVPVTLITIFFISCSTSKKHTSNSSNNRTTSSSSKVLEDGLSFATAIVIHEKTETKGVDAEYDWIRKHYSNYKINGQKLVSHGKSQYDIITIVFSDDKELKLYFNISKFFGKF